MYIVENLLKFGACVLVCVCACYALQFTFRTNKHATPYGLDDGGIRPDQCSLSLYSCSAVTVSPSPAGSATAIALLLLCWPAQDVHDIPTRGHHTCA